MGAGMTAREEFRDYVLRFLHIPYRWGGSNPLTGLDCSGAVQLWLEYLTIDPPGDQSADALYRYFLVAGRGRNVAVADLGTLLFFGRGERVTHVAMALDAVRMIEAGGGGADTTSPEVAARRSAYVKVSRISRRSDLVSMIVPAALSW
jgi:cell wall-associated NlpC family hydrolase